MVPPSAESVFEKALFLLAVASGLRSSQLHALTCQPGLTVFSAGFSSVSLAPSPGLLAKIEREGLVLDPCLRSSQLHTLMCQPGLMVFLADFSSVSLAPAPGCLAKNEQEGHILDPLLIPAWWEDVPPHPSCLVVALCAYLGWTPGVGLDRLFVWPTSCHPCSRPHLVGILKRVISSADPAAAPLGNDTHRVSSSMVFLHLELVENISDWPVELVPFARHLLLVSLC